MHSLPFDYLASVDVGSTSCGLEDDMKMSGKLGYVMGLALAALAGNAHAADGYYNGSQQGYYGGYNNGSDYYDNSYNNYNDSNRGRQIVRCESRDQRTAYCGVDTRGGVRLVDQISQRSCIRGRTWGADARGIWVTSGCRASFEINARGSHDDGYGNGYGGGYDNSNGYGYGGGRLIRCESRDSRTVFCNVDIRYGVRLVNQISRSSCVEGRTWGVARGGLWVSRGCRAQFRVGDNRNGDEDYGYRY